jgi:hypothetical protein
VGNQTLATAPDRTAEPAGLGRAESVGFWPVRGAGSAGKLGRSVRFFGRKAQNFGNTERGFPAGLGTVGGAVGRADGDLVGPIWTLRGARRGGDPRRQLFGRFRLDFPLTT